MAHTPGPWHASAVSLVVGSLITAGDNLVSGVGHKIAAAIPQKDRSETEANARLMAAAPDLLRCLKTALALMDGDPGCIDCEEWKAIIAKVEGR